MRGGRDLPSQGDTFYSSNHGPLNAGASVISQVILTYQDFDGAQHAQHDASLIHIIDILAENVWIL